MPKLLSIVWYKVLPARYGGQKMIAGFTEHLAAQIPLVCLASSNNESTAPLPYSLLPELPVSKWQFINPIVWIKILTTAKTTNVTHIILEHPYHGIAGCLCKIFLHKKLVIHSHNIEHTRFKQQQKWWWKWLMYYEKWVHQQADLNLFSTKADMLYAIFHFKLSIAKCIIVPYGISRQNELSKQDGRETIERKHPILRGKKILLFAGTLDYLPNAKAVENIHKYVAPTLPAKEYVIVVCGRNKLPEFQYLKALKHDAVVYAGEVNDIEMYYAAADVFINPLAGSSGVQTKTFDALENHLNVVCFKSNTEGLPVDLLSEKVFIAADSDWDDFSFKIVAASDNFIPTPAYFFEVYHWKKITSHVAQKINENISSSKL